jgi:hypothetical protein
MSKKARPSRFPDGEMNIHQMRQKGCLSSWFPAIKEAGLPVPDTRIIRTDCNLDYLLDGEDPPGFERFIEELGQAVAAVGLPAFLRTGQTSGKFRWRHTCYLTDLKRLSSHVFNLVEFSAIVDIAGLDTSVWVAREYLPVEPAFHAFPGNMPITRERRYFVSGDQVMCHHPYWPEGAFIEMFEDEPSARDWRGLLTYMNYERPEEIEELTELTRRVGQVVEGAWSVDWLSTMEGWYLTDAAPAEYSYHWPGCPNESLCFI